jgi:6-phosphogluconolactonase
MAADRMTTATFPQEHTFATPEELARHVADWIVARARASSERFAICLSGGSTPKRLYELLWGDERFVPHDDPQSNFRMVAEALLRHAPVAAANVHAIPTGGVSAQACAAEYETVLKRFHAAQAPDGERPLFDLTLLGLGEDGHIASLFPGSHALAETRRWVVPVVAESSVDRITLTYPALEKSRVTAFLVVGERKRGALARVRAGDTALPATRLRSAGEVFWFTDRAAASAAPALARE